MNRNQSICLWAGIAALVLMGLFPPWYHTSDTWTVYHYSFLWRPPMMRTYDYTTQDWHEPYRPQMRYQLDTHRLYVQWIMVAVLTSGLVLQFHDRKAAKTSSESGS